MERCTLRLVALPCLALLIATGCGVGSGRFDSGRPADLSASPDAGATMDLAGAPHDLAEGGGADFAAPDDLAMADDLAIGKPDLASAACTKIANWPGLAPEGAFDPMGPVTTAVSIDKAMLPANGLFIEDYSAPNEKWPKSVTYQKGDLYVDCEVCATLGPCDNMGCDLAYFAQAGTVTVSRADRSVKGGRMIATAKNLTLVEWDFAKDEPVKGGKCVQIDNASFDVTWGGSDGGVAADMKLVDLGVVDQKPVDGGADDLKKADDGAVADLRPADLRPADLAATGDLALACTPRINELQTAGASATDEWIELFNPCAKAVDLTGWKLAYRSAGNNNGGADTVVYTFTETIAAGGYFLVANTGYPGMSDAKFVSSGLAATGGAVGLRDPLATLIDAVSYDVLTIANSFTEKSPAPNPPASQSLARQPNGSDSNDNSKDFKLTIKPTPRAANL